MPVSRELSQCDHAGDAHLFLHAEIPPYITATCFTPVQRPINTLFETQQPHSHYGAEMYAVSVLIHFRLSAAVTL